MKKFLFIYNASDDGDSDEAWISWFTAIKQNLADMGNPFNGGQIVTAAGAKEITEWSDFIGGYSLVTAIDMDTAVAIASGCPNKAGVRIFEAIPM